MKIILGKKVKEKWYPKYAPHIILGTNSANDSTFITVWQTRNSTDSTDGIYALRLRNNNYSIANELKVNANTAVTGGSSDD